MFVAGFRLKTWIQKWLFTVQDYLDFARLHPAREMKRLALEESVEYVRTHMPRAIGMESAREVLAMALDRTSLPGLYLEFGVYKGGTIRFIAAKVGRSQQVYGFDSFEGLPESWTGNSFGFDAKGKLPRVPPNVRLQKGLFADVLPSWLEAHPGSVAFLHIDCDLYQSTKTVFDQIADRIVPGTIVVFDEYFNYPNWQAHEFRAFQELVDEFQIRYEYLAYARLQVAVRIIAVGGRRLDNQEVTGLSKALEGTAESGRERQPIGAR